LSTARPRAVDNAVLHGRWPLAPGAGLRPRPLRAQRASRWSCRLLRFRWRWAWSSRCCWSWGRVPGGRAGGSPG